MVDLEEAPPDAGVPLPGNPRHSFWHASPALPADVQILPSLQPDSYQTSWWFLLICQGASVCDNLWPCLEVSHLQWLLSRSMNRIQVNSWKTPCSSAHIQLCTSQPLGPYAQCLPCWNGPCCYDSNLILFFCMLIHSRGTKDAIGILKLHYTETDTLNCMSNEYHDQNPHRRKRNLIYSTEHNTLTMYLLCKEAKNGKEILNFT